MEGEEAFAAGGPDFFEEEKQATGVSEGEGGADDGAEGDDNEAFCEPLVEGFFGGDAEGC